MENEITKTHWLQNPNKNYLGHWDLPNGRDIILTIKSAQWEEVKNPIINISSAKRVLRFEEDVKPFICNETNAQTIMKSTAQKYVEDSIGCKIQLYQSEVKMLGEMVDCLRVRNIPQSQLFPKYISESQRDHIVELIQLSTMTIEEICQIMKIDAIAKLPLIKYENICVSLKNKGKENADN